MFYTYRIIDFNNFWIIKEKYILSTFISIVVYCYAYVHPKVWPLEELDRMILSGMSKKFMLEANK